MIGFMPDILHLNLHREFFDAIARKRKRIEYRKQSPYWRKRLDDRKYDAILFRNGYAKDAPEMLVEFRGLRRYGIGRDAYYAIRLGQILRIKSWSPECPCILWRFNVPSMHFISLSAGPIFLRQGKIACSDNSAIAPSFPRRLMVPATVSSFRSP